MAEENLKKEEQENLKNEDISEAAIEEKDISSLEKELEETTDRLKRIMAEFENYKKRSSKERENLYTSIQGDIVESFLPIIDNLEKAVDANTEDINYKQGVELVLKQFMDTLKKIGVEPIPTVGTTFDPEFHDAVSSVQDENLGEKEIKEEYRKGYKIGTRVIRHAMVVVAN